MAVIISRKGSDKNAQKAARGCLRENGKLIICLSDEEINKLIDIKSKSGVPGNELELILDNQCHLVNQFQIKIQWFSFRESHCFFRQKLKKYYENS